MMQKFRHVVYWTSAVILVIPVGILELAAIASDWLDSVISRYRVWAYQENYWHPGK